jgi:hypothetical protein
MPQKKVKEKKGTQIVWYVVVLGLVILISYSFYYFKITSTEDEGIVVCDEGKCFWASHLHAQINIVVCGEEVKLPLESGLLSATHTHKKLNQLHFHERLPVDPATEKVTDFAPLLLGNFFDYLDLRFTSECFGENCNGEVCGNIPGSLSMEVNGKPNTEFREYTWKEGDEIVIRFG